MATRRYSFSQLNTFSICAFQWYDRYYLWNKAPSTPAMDRGNALHKEFEDVFAGRREMTDAVAPYRRAVEKLANGRQIITEMPLAMTRDGKPCATTSGNRFFQGYADLVLMPGPYPIPEDLRRSGNYKEFNETGLAYYLDWKTGKPGWEKELQLDWSAVLIRKNSLGHVNRVATRLVYTTTGTFYPQDSWRVLGPEQLDEAERELYRQIGAVEETIANWERVPPLERSTTRAKAHFGQTRSGICKVCSVRTCEFAGGAK